MFNSILSDTSSITLLTPSFPPTLSIHGSADTLIPLSDSLALKGALEKLGIANELLVVEGAEHGLEPEKARGEEWGRAVGWLERWV
jgi:dipeptidyl aminopeptidase/acylaminoacyl peptidase